MIVNCIQTAKIKTSINNLSDMCSNLYDQGNEYNFTLVFKCGVCVIISPNTCTAPKMPPAEGEEDERGYVSKV